MKTKWYESLSNITKGGFSVLFNRVKMGVRVGDEIEIIASISVFREVTNRKDFSLEDVGGFLCTLWNL